MGATSPEEWITHVARFQRDATIAPSRSAHKIKRISDTELEHGLRETVVFGSPAPVLSEPQDEAITPSDGTAPDPLEQPVEP